MSAGAPPLSEAGEAKMVVPGWMVSVVPDLTNTWSVRTYLYAANCGSSSANGCTNQHGGSVLLETCLKDQVRAYPGLRVDVATDVDHVLEGLSASRRHGQLRVATGTERVPIKTSPRPGLQVGALPTLFQEI